MAAPLQLIVLISIFISATIVATFDVPSTPPSLPPSSPSLFQEQTYPSSPFGPILTDLGFQELAAASSSSLLTAIKWRGPTTIFAPSDSSLLTCPSCSVPLLLQEHAIPGLYPLQFLSTLAFGTKIETLASGRCITITSDTNATKIFVGGVQVTHPELYNDGLVVVHGIQGFISHLSPLSCSIERMVSLSFPPPPPLAAFFIMRTLLKDTMLRLRVGGYSLVALALREKYADLLDLQAMTVFALDDVSIFSGGHKYISDLRFHIVPNRQLTAADLERLPTATALPTMERGTKLVVTTPGGGGPLAPMRINYVKIKSPDLVHNLKIVVHGLSLPFPHVHPTAVAGLGQIGRSGWEAAGSAFTWNARIGDTMRPHHIHMIDSNTEIEDYPGLGQCENIG
ncbi:hypothetical protein F0562_018108 [Nyssa sinensis]|uniref:FAS1 domain-containing protein n=1 Tax=Nyssa sinensis TaxID=561372 RepID=A0A5J4Z9A9_9ASTE|nr:hypothetical protein F0562_018108 [Nyssa sinensis]